MQLTSVHTTSSLMQEKLLSYYHKYHFLMILCARTYHTEYWRNVNYEMQNQNQMFCCQV